MAFNEFANKLKVGQGFLNTGLNALDGLTGRGRDGGQSKFNVQKLKSQIATLLLNGIVIN